MAAPCPLCGGTEHEKVSSRDRHGNPLVSVLCLGCGVITNDPIPTDAELAAFYTRDYRKSYKGAAIPSKRQVWRNFGRLVAHFEANTGFYRAPITGLDLGAGSGEFLFLAKVKGLHFIGVEPNEDYAHYCRDMLGLDVRTNLLEELTFPEASFDMIRLSHVLEHMRDPVRSLKTLSSWLKPGGLLYIEVPQTDDEARRKLRGRMFHFGHIFNFDPFTLRLAAARAGLVEAPDAAARLAGTTGTFFVKGDAVSPPPDACRANAARARSFMADHNARTVPAPKDGNAVSRLVSTLAARSAEALAARRFKTHRAIAEHFGARLVG
ncbi:MAG: class I SAM-dependent methyltransferase [Rhizobiaceae bacterium]|jgi:SAM-dependent methyltransferase|nr:class I SAM-dependent methyltransferase [Rhizobiaceae bacterium]